jgi:hypothetical protein
MIEDAKLMDRIKLVVGMGVGASLVWWPDEEGRGR